MALTDKQRRFIEEYLVDFNATQAAIRAGYSEDTARSIGSENLTKPDIASALAERAKSLTEEADVTTAMVIDGLLTEAKRTGRGASHAARVSAWTQLGKYLAMFTDRHEHSGPGGGPLEIAVTRKVVNAKNRIAGYMNGTNGANGNGKP